VPRDDEGQQVLAQRGRIHPAPGFAILGLQQPVEKVGHRTGAAGAAPRDGGVGLGMHLLQLPRGEGAGGSRGTRPERRERRECSSARRRRYRLQRVDHALAVTP
jgi:hypothetical protein